MNRQFHAFMTAKYGTAFSSKTLKETGIGSRFMMDFEHEKRQFEGDDDSEDITIAFLMNCGEQDGYDPIDSLVTVTRYFWGHCLHLRDHFDSDGLANTSQG